MINAFFAGIAVLSLAACVPSSTATRPADAQAPGYQRVPVAGQVATPAEHAACEAAGGEIRPDGLLGTEHCIQTFPDSGQACTDSSDCLGHCLNAGEWVQPGEPVAEGQCQATDSGFGCAQAVTDGLAEPGLCVD